MGNSETIPIEAFKVIPFFDAASWSPDRAISSLHFFVKGEWHCWFPAGNELQRVYAWPSEASYFGDAPERSTDQSFQFLNLTYQRASFPEMYRASHGIWNDFQNFATSLAKINLFFQSSKKTKGTETTRFVQTEIEYIVMVARGVYDLLQEMIAAHWDRIRLHKPLKSKRQLPKSFADVVLKGDQPRSSEELIEKYGLPKVFADWYVSQTRFFKWLRSLRNRMAHGGGSPVKILFCAERGYAIQRGEKPWCDLYDWPKEVEVQNGLVPIRPAICTIIWNTVTVTDSFAQVLERTIEFPKELFPGLKYYSRGYHDREFHQIGEVLTNSWWCDTRLPDQPIEDKPQAPIHPKPTA
jgi:hypothetical protein